MGYAFTGNEVLVPAKPEAAPPNGARIPRAGGWREFFRLAAKSSFQPTLSVAERQAET
jgi:hypothetical protein